MLSCAAENRNTLPICGCVFGLSGTWMDGIISFREISDEQQEPISI